MVRETLTFNIVNNTNGLVPVSILGNPQNVMDNSNATTKYNWDVTSLIWGTQNSIIIEYKGINQTLFSIAQTTFTTQSYQAICDALNTLNLGSFFVTTSGSNTYINNYNQNVVFGQLTINSTSTATLIFDNITLLPSSDSFVLYNPFPTTLFSAVSGVPDFLSYNITSGSTIQILYTGRYCWLKVNSLDNGIIASGSTFVANAGFEYILQWNDTAP